MARTVDEATRIKKYNEILDCAQRLIYTKGYGDMSVQDIVNELQISKGAFFHYFASKSALLEALLERTTRQGMEVIAPIADDPSLTPVQKLETIIQAGMQWKSGQKDYMMAILRAWYSDENSLVRQKTLRSSVHNIGELLNRVFQEGIDQGVFHTNFPGMAGKIVYALLTQMSDSLGYILLRVNSDPPDNYILAFSEMEEVIRAYTDSIERILGAKPGTLHLIDPEAMREWLPGN
ncbi:TetR family transcriptional regulator [Leptolinea sp. HRD-7]|nr:TetR family transcriptional regulator [Leptolinea sp. HRD-7]